MKHDNIRDELDALRERVRQLENEVASDDETHSQSNGTAHDHRDAAVLDALEQRDAAPSKRGLTKLYQTTTDIVDGKTAAKRARRLRATEAYTEAVEK